MLLNSERKRVAEWVNENGVKRLDPAHCPECGGLLTPVRGDVVRWHWRHHAAHRNPNCSMIGGESEWHLAMKDRHEELGFLVEYPFEHNGASFRFDALSEQGRAYPIREFVNSLSKSYLAKSDALRDVSEFVVWVFNGSEFVSSRSKPLKRHGQGRKGLLKPTAQIYAEHFHRNGQAVVVDHSWGWKLWKGDVWFEVGKEFDGALLERERQLMYRRARAA